jgi:hypothetical protein
MELTTLYGLIVAGVLVFLLISRTCRLVAQWYESGPALILRQIIYPYLYRRYGIVPPVTRFRAGLFIVYLAVGILCNLYQVSDRNEASIRSACLSIINMIPLFITGRIHTIMQTLGLSQQSVLAVHGATGVLVIAQAATHVIIETSKTAFEISERVNLYGVIVSLI